MIRHVTILVLPGALASTISIPLEMLGAANDIARAGRKRQRVKVELVSLDREPAQLAGGLRVLPDRKLSELEQSDLVFVPGLWGNPRARLMRSLAICPWLRERHEEGARLCAITTGAIFLAEAGLLDGLPATTHWRFFDSFASSYPNVKLERKRFITRAQRIYCTGSVNAVRDLMLHFIDESFDSDVTAQVARHFTHELKRSYESMLLEADQQSSHHDETIIKVQEWLQENYAQSIQVTDIAKRFRLSVRSLNRRFRQATNTTPLQYLQEIRIEHAEGLLKRSNLVIAEVADRVGYQDASYFCSLFKRLNGVTPNEYRRLVRSKIFLADNRQRPPP